MLIVGVAPAAVTDSKLGTPLIETDKVSSESTAVRTIPNCFDPPAVTVRDEGAVKVGVSASLSVSSVAAVMTFVKVLPEGSVLRCSVAVMRPSLSPAKLTVVAASTPFVIATGTGAWLPSLNDTLPLSSVSTPATVNGTALAVAAPIG